MRWILAIILTIVALLGGAFAYLYSDFQQFLQQPLAVSADDETLLIPHGSSYPAIVKQLAARGYTQPGWHWRVLGRLRREQGRAQYQAGEYQFNPGATPNQVLDQLVDGDVVHRSFTIIEGWTAAHMRQALAEIPAIQRVTADWDDARLAQELGIEAQNADANVLEGWFLPASYDYHRGHTDLELLQRAHKAMQQALDKVWQEREEGLPYQTPYELLTMASIVEKETGKASERPEVAGVFVRRLHKGMRLQTDPTIIYGLGAAFDGNLKRVHLRTDGPYNTYTRFGLPPSPIALLGVAALQAAAHPATGDSLYFVATGDGGHVFSKTLAEHERNVDRYQRRRKSRK